MQQVRIPELCDGPLHKSCNGVRPGTDIHIYVQYVFGGAGEGAVIYNHLSVFDTVTDSWLDTSALRLPKDTYLLYIFGGYDAGYDLGYCADMWKFSPMSSSWKELSLGRMTS